MPTSTYAPCECCWHPVVSSGTENIVWCSACEDDQLCDLADDCWHIAG
jgi:hypothetical protein